MGKRFIADVEPAAVLKKYSQWSKGARQEMPHIYKVKDDVRHLGQGPQGRMTVEKSTAYTVVQQLPIESDGRVRYRIKSRSENFERVVTEDQLSPYS